MGLSLRPRLALLSTDARNLPTTSTARIRGKGTINPTYVGQPIINTVYNIIHVSLKLIYSLGL